jgi:hypothetical protein
MRAGGVGADAGCRLAAQREILRFSRRPAHVVPPSAAEREAIAARVALFHV